MNIRNTNFENKYRNQKTIVDKNLWELVLKIK